MQEYTVKATFKRSRETAVTYEWSSDVAAPTAEHALFVAGFTMGQELRTAELFNVAVSVGLA